MLLSKPKFNGPANVTDSIRGMLDDFVTKVKFANLK
jgi:hypothetical protein